MYVIFCQQICPLDQITQSFHFFALFFRSLYPPISQRGEGTTATRRAWGCKQNVSRKRPKNITTGNETSVPRNGDSCSKMCVNCDLKCMDTACYTCTCIVCEVVGKNLLMVHYKRCWHTVHWELETTICGWPDIHSVRQGEHGISGIMVSIMQLHLLDGLASNIEICYNVTNQACLCNE